MRMPWGKYKGTEVAAVPADYLEWVRDNLSIQGELAYEIDTLLRGGGQRIADRRKALVDLVSTLDDRQVARVLGYARKLVRGARKK
jgi:hypothetical protein